MKINQGGSSQQGVNLSRVSRSDDGGSRILGNIHKEANSWKARLMKCLLLRANNVRPDNISLKTEMFVNLKQD